MYCGSAAITRLQMQWLRRSVFCVVLIAGASNSTLSAHADDTVSHGIYPPIHTYNDLKYAYTVRQGRDFTCGSASLATILKFHYNMPITEDTIIDLIVKRYTREQFQQKAKEGLSFEDLIYAARELGFKAEAATIPLAEVEKLNGPVIIQMKIKDNEHFTVLRKKVGEWAYISDPIQGDIVLDANEFKEKFQGPALAVWPAYVGDDFFSGLSVIRDPTSVERSLSGLIVSPFYIRSGIVR